jgi:predicted nuclease with RNAse H fold
MTQSVRFTGVDLAAQPAGTAVAVIEVGPRLVLDHLEAPADDAAILAVASDSAKVGLDSPLGWPDAFIDYLDAHRGLAQPSSTEPAMRWLDERTYRVTDLELRADTSPALRGISPLSAAADRLGRTALRCASLQARMSARWGAADVARDGSGRIVEVYPAASLSVWGMPHRGYKGRDGAEARGRITTMLLERAGFHDPVGVRARLGTDHVLDALIAALAAADAWASGWVADHPAARTEGWIHVPMADLASLAWRVRARAGMEPRPADSRVARAHAGSGEGDCRPRATRGPHGRPARPVGPA